MGCLCGYIGTQVTCVVVNYSSYTLGLWGSNEGKFVAKIFVRGKRGVVCTTCMVGELTGTPNDIEW